MNAHDKWLQAPYEAAAIDHEALQAEIASEAEARLIEWQDMDIAARDAHDYELLDGEIDFIISFAAKVMAAPEAIREHEFAVLGQYIVTKVQRAAFDLATHVCTERVAA